MTAAYITARGTEMAQSLEGGADMIILSDMGGNFSQLLEEAGTCS